MLDANRIVGRTEDEIYRTLGLPWIPVEIRDDDEAVAVAAKRELPALISRDDIRGDLHMHSQWSDGRNSIEEMVAGCVALGYEYMAITDHSPHSAAARNLSRNDVDNQAREIATLRERYPAIEILHGVEVDILSDGTLDFPDEVLQRFDIVLASLHEPAGHGGDQLLERYVSAMRHPLVNVITHPANRLVAHRPGYDIDYDRLFATAVATGTLLEIDGAPSHLDLDATLARRAAAAGVSLVIDSDCHRSELLDFQMRLGVAIARRGWVRPDQVMNTQSIAELRARIAAKRAG
jgi:DNA polymerase (family 10)